VISFADVVIGDGEAVRCARCVPEAAGGFRSPDDVLANVREVAQSWSAGAGPNLVFVGAEPFAHPQLPALVAGAASLGVERIGLRTDGGALSVDGNALGAIHAGVRLIEIVALGDQGIHDDLTGATSGFAMARQGARAFLDEGRETGATVVVTGRIPVCRHNLASLPGAVAALAEMGAVSVELSVSERTQKAVGLSSWVSAAFETGMVNGVWVYIREPGRLPASSIGLHGVAPSGRWDR
jgi:hypothetical protein